MVKYIYRRALNQWKLLLLLWLSVLIASTFIITAPSYLGWIKGMIYQDTLSELPISTKNITITTGSQPLIEEAFIKNDQIVEDVSGVHLDGMVDGINSALKSTEYYWGLNEPNKSRTASLLSFTAFDSIDKFVSLPKDNKESFSSKSDIFSIYE